jgi:hypothetical protein
MTPRQRSAGAAASSAHSSVTMASITRCTAAAVGSSMGVFLLAPAQRRYSSSDKVKSRLLLIKTYRASLQAPALRTCDGDTSGLRGPGKDRVSFMDHGCGGGILPATISTYHRRGFVKKVNGRRRQWAMTGAAVLPTGGHDASDRAHAGALRVNQLDRF